MTTNPLLERMALWSLRDDVLLETESPDRLVLFTRWGELRVENPDATTLDFLRRMSYGPVSLDNALGADTDERQRRSLAALLERLQHVVIRSLGLAADFRPLMSVAPITRQARFVPGPAPRHRPLRLSWTATLRTYDDSLVLESPVAAHRVVLHQPVAGAVLAAMGTPRSVEAVATSLGLPVDLVADIAGYVIATGILVVGEGRTAKFAEDADPVLRLWSHHELMFHARSRGGRNDGPVGAVFADDGRVSPEPVVKQVAGRRVRLFRPDYATLVANDPPLTAAVEARRSYRSFGPEPVTAEQLGELLYRTTRVRALHGSPADISDRPYPSTLGQHELDLYVVAGRCAGLTRAIYHYDPVGHVLTEVNDAERDTGRLCEAARIAGGMRNQPPMLIIITARFGRLSWMYQGGAYAATLKHVGVLQQNLYLVATAMGLAPCAVSVRDDDDQTLQALGLDWRLESDVGEFVLGNPSAEEPARRFDQLVNDADWPERSRHYLPLPTFVDNSGQITMPADPVSALINTAAADRDLSWEPEETCVSATSWSSPATT